MFECVSVKPKFETAKARTPAMCVQMTRYNSAFESPIVFPPQTLANGLCETVSKLGLQQVRRRAARTLPIIPCAPSHTPLASPPSDHPLQFHVAETEKYAHVTFFFNGGREEPFEGQINEMKESPKVATYDLEPKMAAEPVADTMVRSSGPITPMNTHALIAC